MIRLLYITLIIGILLYYFDRKFKPLPAVVEYRYLPRTWDMQIDDNAFTKGEIFTQMIDAETGNVWLQAYQNKKLT